MLKRLMVLLMVITLSALTVSCLSPKEIFLKKGAVLLTQKEVADAFRGNTIICPDWSAYYREDGARLVDARGQRIFKMKWNVDPTGRFCQQSISGKMYCGLKVYRLGEKYKMFDGGTVYTFKVVAGNPLKL